MRRVIPTAAALVTLGAITAVLLNPTPRAARAARADVVKAAEMHKLVKYTVTQTNDRKDGGSASSRYVVYADLKAPRYRQEHRGTTFNGTIEYEIVIIRDGKKDQALAVTTDKVAAGVKEDDESLAEARKLGSPRKEAAITRLGEDSYDPVKKAQPILDTLRELEQHKDVVVTKDKLGGREAVRYYLEDGKKTFKLWVDAKTELPLRFELETLDPTLRTPRSKWVYSDFEWDPELPKGTRNLDALFDLTPPDGYKLLEHPRGR